MEIPKIRFTIEGDPNSIPPYRYIIYHISDPITQGIIYIGKSVSGLKRPKEHFSDSYIHKKKPLYNKIRKMLSEGRIPVIGILDFTEDVKKLSGLEIKCIYEAKNEGEPLKNQTIGGGGTLGLKRTEESKRKISEILKRLPIEKTKERDARMLALGKANKGKTYNLEARQNMQISSKKRIPILCLENGKEYYSAREAAKDLGIKCHKSILKAARTGKKIKNNSFSLSKKPK